MSLIPDNTIVDGYFYTFVYRAKDGSIDVDESPLIFCLGPSLKSDNCFVGLNFHKIPEKFREILIKKMHQSRGILEKNGRWLFSAKVLNEFVPGAMIAVREYNRKRVYHPFRIPSTEIPLYIYGDGKGRISDNIDMKKFIYERLKVKV